MMNAAKGSAVRRRIFDRRNASVQTVVSMMSKHSDRSFAAMAASRAVFVIGRGIAEDGLAGLGDLKVMMLRRDLGTGFDA